MLSFLSNKLMYIETNCDLGFELTAENFAIFFAFMKKS
jgi:hypothetical protein